jgi:hypothetical protein
MKFITTNLVCLLLILLSFSAEAVTYTSSGNGEWSSASSWNPSGPPTSGSSSSNKNVIIIKAGDDISISGYNVNLSNVVIYVRGKLTMSRVWFLIWFYPTINISGTGSGIIISPGGSVVEDVNGKTNSDIAINGTQVWDGSDGTQNAGTGTIYWPSSVNDPLPVELISWNASFSKGEVATNWSTSAEQKNQYFTIEESTDGKEFYEIAQIPTQGNGTTIHEYNAIVTPKGKGILYFRLKQTDVNGDFTYSPVISLSTATANDDNEWTMFPNPVTNKTVTIQASTSTSSSIMLLDPQTGTVVFQQESSFAEAGLVTITLPDNLKSGVYLLQIQNAKGNDSKPLMIY